MAEKSIWEILGDLIIDSDQFAKEHPGFSFVLSVMSVIGYARIAELLESYDSPAPDYDPDIMEAQNAAQLNQLENRIRMTLDELLSDTQEKLTFLENNPRLQLMSADCRYQHRQCTELVRQLQGMNCLNREHNAENIRQLHRNTTQLYEEFNRFETNWQTACSEWRTRHSQLQLLLDRAKDFELPVDTTEGTETIRIDCDFWSHNALSEAGKTLPPSDQPEDTSIETFLTLCEQVERLHQRIAAMIRQACQDYLASQARIQLASSIYENLFLRGWYLAEESDFAFAGNDERAELKLKLYSPVSDLVEFVFKPDNTMQMRPKFKSVHNRSLQQMLAGTIQSALQGNGITVQNITLL